MKKFVNKRLSLVGKRGGKSLVCGLGECLCACHFESKGILASEASGEVKGERSTAAHLKGIRGRTRVVAGEGQQSPWCICFSPSGANMKVCDLCYEFFSNWASRRERG